MVKALIIKTSALGDIVQTFPAIQYLNQVSPGCEIHWVVEKASADLIRSHPLILKTFVIDTKRWRKEPFHLSTRKALKEFLLSLRSSYYDVVFDFQGNFKSGLVTYLAKGKNKIGFSRKCAPEWVNSFFTNQQVTPLSPQNIRLDYFSLVEAWSNQRLREKVLTKLNLTPEEQLQLNQLKKEKKTYCNLMVSPGSQWPNKQLPLDSLVAFLKKIDETFTCTFWLIHGSNQEKKRCIEIEKALKDAKVCDKMSFPLLQHWMGEMDQVIAMDSFPLHLAAEGGANTFSIFGPSSACKYQPLGDNHHCFQGSCPYGKVFEKRCPILRTCETGACTSAIDPHILFQTYLSFSSHLLCRH